MTVPKAAVSNATQLTRPDPMSRGRVAGEADRVVAGHGRVRGDAGYSVLEAALVLPVMILLTMLVIQYALLWHGRHVAEAAAQDGLRAASGYLSTGTDGRDAAAAYVQAVAPNLLQHPDVTATVTATTVTVTVRAEVLPLMAFGHFPVRETAFGSREFFVAPGR